MYGSDSRHPLVDRLYHVQEKINAVMKELNARRSDPRVAHLVRERLQSEDARARHDRRLRNSLRAHRSIYGVISTISRATSLELFTCLLLVVL